LRTLRRCLVLPALLVATAAPAADAGNGKRVAEARCVTCHTVGTDRRREVADAPPFEVIAQKYTVDPGELAFAILEPHPRMSVALTRREAEDVAAYINTLGN
jgi:mono/diheme cytochrome c family protein